MVIGYEHSPTADAIYIRFSDLPYARGRDLDDDRRIDYAENGEVIGVELLGVSEGVNLDDLPLQHVIGHVLKEHSIPIYA